MKIRSLTFTYCVQSHDLFSDQYLNTLGNTSTFYDCKSLTPEMLKALEKINYSCTGGTKDVV